MATAPSPNDLTRQQLDELDALLQRMLTLPLSPDTGAPAAPSAAEPAVTNWRVDPPAPAVMPSPHLVAPPPAPEPERFAPPVARTPTVSEPTPPPRPTPAPQVVPPPEPAVPVVERKPAPPAPAPEPTPPPIITLESRPEPESEPVPVVLWPLVAFNWTVDTVLGLLGPPGRLVRSGFGKNVLGLAGVALLALTAAHVATDRGWVTLPFPVPWPR